MLKIYNEVNFKLKKGNLLINFNETFIIYIFELLDCQLLVHSNNNALS